LNGVLAFAVGLLQPIATGTAWFHHPHAALDALQKLRVNGVRMV